MKETKKDGQAPKTEPKVNLPDGWDWGAEETTGFEQTRPEDFGIPFLAICQSGSPELKATHKDHATKKIEGIREGSIFNTITRQILHQPGEEPAIFIPCAHHKLWQEWRKRNEGGGFVKSHPTPEILGQCKRNDKNQDELPNGNLIQTTSYFFGFAQFGPEEWNRAIIAMTSTQLKAARNWLNLTINQKLAGKPLPMFSHTYKVSTVIQSNDEGAWYGWKVELGRILVKADSELIVQAREVSKEMTTQKLLGAPIDSSPESDGKY